MVQSWDFWHIHTPTQTSIVLVCNIQGKIHPPSSLLTYLVQEKQKLVLMWVNVCMYSDHFKINWLFQTALLEYSNFLCSSKLCTFCKGGWLIQKYCTIPEYMGLAMPLTFLMVCDHELNWDIDTGGKNK